MSASGDAAISVGAGRRRIDVAKALRSSLHPKCVGPGDGVLLIDHISEPDSERHPGGVFLRSGSVSCLLSRV
jgi:hypothetical protein